MFETSPLGGPHNLDRLLKEDPASWICYRAGWQGLKTRHLLSIWCLGLQTSIGFHKGESCLRRPDKTKSRL